MEHNPFVKSKKQNLPNIYTIASLEETCILCDKFLILGDI